MELEECLCLRVIDDFIAVHPPWSRFLKMTSFSLLLIYFLRQCVTRNVTHITRTQHEDENNCNFFFLKLETREEFLKRLRTLRRIKKKAKYLLKSWTLANNSNLLPSFLMVNLSFCFTGYPDSFPGSIDCRWLIRVPIQQVVYLKVEYLQLYGSIGKLYHTH